MSIQTLLIKHRYVKQYLMHDKLICMFIFILRKPLKFTEKVDIRSKESHKLTLGDHDSVMSVRIDDLQAWVSPLAV